MNTTASAEKPTILLTFDVEDWFQVENLKSAVSRDSWDRRELRVFNNTVRIMDLLDRQQSRPRATFFVLGWIARRLPELVRQIAARGHEVASHGDRHAMLDQMPVQALKRDLHVSKALLEDITGEAVAGYRAPSFSISKESLDLIRQAGYQYDSSYNSFGSHGRYGHVDLDGYPRRRGVCEISPGFFEVPVSNLHFGSRIFPLGGGGYFRLFPPAVFRLGMTAVLKQEQAFTFYAHPWEFDPHQPRVQGIPMSFKFRHYVNLNKTAVRLAGMIRHFSSCRFSTIGAHLKSV